MTWVNYIRFFTDSFYLNTLWITVKTSALATIFTMLLGFPVAYLIARMRSKWSMLLLAGIVVATFVTIVIKVFGLIIIFSADGWINKVLMGLGIVSSPYSIIGNQTGVVVGLMHFTLGFGVLLLYSVIQTIPRSLEDAAQIHGASRWRMHMRVLLPLSLPGVTVGRADDIQHVHGCVHFRRLAWWWTGIHVAGADPAHRNDGSQVFNGRDIVRRAACHGSADQPVIHHSDSAPAGCHGWSSREHTMSTPALTLSEQILAQRASGPPPRIGFPWGKAFHYRVLQPVLHFSAGADDRSNRGFVPRR